jgi:hypothetical protein
MVACSKGGHARRCLRCHEQAQLHLQLECVNVSMRQHTSAYVRSVPTVSRIGAIASSVGMCKRQHTSAYVRSVPKVSRTGAIESSDGMRIFLTYIYICIYIYIYIHTYMSACSRT